MQDNEKNNQIVMEMVQKIAATGGHNKNVDAIQYRADYGDYRIFLDNNSHCEIREKLIDILFKEGSHEDTEMEINFRIEHSVEFEEWEDNPADTKEDLGIVVDDEE